MKVITLANQKGGCGKTTTAQTLAIGLVNQGYHVLMIDCDPQCNLSSLFGIESEKRTKGTLLDVMRQDMTINDVAYSARINLDIVTCHPRLSKADKEFSDIDDCVLLNDAIEALNGAYDYVVIDTPPNVGTLTTNALLASDYLIIPSTPDFFSVQGLQQIKQHLANVQRLGGTVQTLGVLLTRCDRTTLTTALKDEIAQFAKEMDSSLFNASIRQGVAIRESQLMKSDIFTDAPKSHVAMEYKEFVDEVITRIKERG